MRGSGVSVSESEGVEIWLWMEKAPPIVISPFLDKRGKSGLPSISHTARCSSAKAPAMTTASSITKIQSHIIDRAVNIHPQPSSLQWCLLTSQICLFEQAQLYNSQDDDDS